MMQARVALCVVGSPVVFESNGPAMEEAASGPLKRGAPDFAASPQEFEEGREDDCRRDRRLEDAGVNQVLLNPVLDEEVQMERPAEEVRVVADVNRVTRTIVEATSHLDVHLSRQKCLAAVVGPARTAFRTHRSPCHLLGHASSSFASKTQGLVSEENDWDEACGSIDLDKCIP